MQYEKDTLRVLKKKKKEMPSKSTYDKPTWVNLKKQDMALTFKILYKYISYVSGGGEVR